MFLSGELQKVSSLGAKEKMMRETAREVEKNPDVLPIIEALNLRLTCAIERLNPKLKAIAEREDGPPIATQIT